MICRAAAQSVLRGKAGLRLRIRAVFAGSHYLDRCDLETQPSALRSVALVFLADAFYDAFGGVTELRPRALKTLASHASN